MLKIFPGAPHDELTVVISSAEALALAQAQCGSVPLRDTENGAGLRRPALASAGVDHWSTAHCLCWQTPSPASPHYL